MSLVTRQGKGSKLTIQEMDGNLEYLEQLALQQPLEPYKVYTALLTQSTVGRPGPPQESVLQNTFRDPISFTYISEGTFGIISNGDEFTEGRTLTQLQLWGSDARSKGRIGNVQWSRPGVLILRVSNVVEGESLVNGIGGDNILTSIEIRVYN